MSLKTSFFLLSILASVHALRESYKSNETQPLQWSHCEFNGSAPIECSNFTIPLDYTNLQPNQTTQLQLLRVPASKKPSMGSIIFNFGGLGITIRPSLARLSRTLQMYMFIP